MRDGRSPAPSANFLEYLRNAIKFTPAGGSIFVTARYVDNGRIDVEVRDNGIGIDPHHLSRIFQAFEQGESDIHVRFGGLGLGLAICQALVEAHHGSISAGSRGRGQGASFTVTLPIAPPNLRQPVDKRDAVRKIHEARVR